MYKYISKHNVIFLSNKRGIKQDNLATVCVFVRCGTFNTKLFLKHKPPPFG